MALHKNCRITAWVDSFCRIRTHAKKSHRISNMELCAHIYVVSNFVAAHYVYDHGLYKSVSATHIDLMHSFPANMRRWASVVLMLVTVGQH